MTTTSAASSPAVTVDLGAALEALGWVGQLLPLRPMSGGAVHPVVCWTPAARHRLAAGPPPTTYRPTLVEWEAAPEGAAPATPICIVGFLHAGRPAAGVDRLRPLAGYGSAAIVVAGVGRLGRWTWAEADVAGIGVVEAPAAGAARVALVGRHGPVATARRSVATRLREEELYGWALEHEMVPTIRPTDRGQRADEESTGAVATGKAEALPSGCCVAHGHVTDGCGVTRRLS